MSKGYKSKHKDILSPTNTTVPYNIKYDMPIGQKNNGFCFWILRLPEKEVVHRPFYKVLISMTNIFFFVCLSTPVFILLSFFLQIESGNKGQKSKRWKKMQSKDGKKKPCYDYIK